MQLLHETITMLHLFLELGLFGLPRNFPFPFPLLEILGKLAIMLQNSEIFSSFVFCGTFFSSCWLLLEELGPASTEIGANESSKVGLSCSSCSGEIEAPQRSSGVREISNCERGTHIMCGVCACVKEGSEGETKRGRE